MRIITEPSVYLLGRMQLDRVELQTFLADINASEWTTAGDVDGDILVEVGGRTCYQSWGKRRSHRDHLENLIASGHLSCLEHSVYTVLITGVSRSLTHELIRHRHLSPSQLSQRYVDESVAEYIAPADLQEQIDEGYGEWTSRWFKADFGIDEYLILREHHRNGAISDDAWAGIEWLFAVGVSHRAYGVLSDHLSAKKTYVCSRCGGPATLETLPLKCAACGGSALHGTELRKAARQAARSVLPNATETKIQLTGNVRAWRELLVKRGSRHAEPEIRKLANAILELLHGESPLLFGDFTRSRLPDGTDELTLPPSED
jgi:thymidylate synthase (FAD)